MTGRTGEEREPANSIRCIGGDSDDGILRSGAKINVVYPGFWNKLYWFCDLRVSCRYVALWNRGINLERGGFSEMVFRAEPL